MNSRINVAVTGYFRTGSSAIVDLLKEYEGVGIAPYMDKSYEHNALYHHGGLYDVCTLLSHGNTLYGSDKVISQFITEMKRLNDYNYVWFGSYQKMFGDKFMNIVNEFVEAIATERDDRTTNHIVKTRFSAVKFIAQLVLALTQKRKFTNWGIKYIYDKEASYCALPTEDELYDAARRFTSGYFSLFDDICNYNVKIFDHIIWPSQVDEQKKCFTDDFKIIVVDRDPRDLFALEKYMPTGKKSHFPTDPVEFCKEWRKTLVSTFKNPNAMIVHFEDLVYEYDNTVKRIEDFLDLKKKQHTKQYEFFDPHKSIENTQVFRTQKSWSDEVVCMESLIGDLLYSFPIERVPDRSLMFADDAVGKMKI